MLSLSPILLSLLLALSASAHPTAPRARDLSHAHAAAVHAAARNALPAPPLPPVARSEPAINKRSSRKKKGKRCAPASTTSPSASAPAANIEAPPSASPTSTHHKGHGGDQGANAPAPSSTPAPLMSSSSSTPPPPAPTTSAASSGGNSGGSSGSSGSSGGLIQGPQTCGGPGATSDDPNGAEWWLNCGLDGSGWNPPDVQISDLVYVDLQDALNSGSGVFDACGAYVSNFENWASQTGIPSIMLASFAMQESGCNPSAVGPNGEQGLMQLTVDKCGPAPDGNCQDPDFNIMTGAQYISTTVQQAGGNVLLGIGTYNGWFLDMTIDSAVAAAGGNCGAMQNFDYLEQFVNWWMQNKNAYDNNAGTYHNQALCEAGTISSIETK